MSETLGQRTVATNCKMETKKRKKIKRLPRTTEMKRWTSHEEDVILNYMQVHTILEKPTARIYYNKLIAETNLKAEWNIVRHKVRHMRLVWQKAKAYRTSALAEAQDAQSAAAIRERVLNMCPHYDQISRVYGDSTAIEVVLLPSREENSNDIPKVESEEDSLMDDLLQTEVDDFNGFSTDESFVDNVKQEPTDNPLPQIVSIVSDGKELQDKRRLLLESEMLELKNAQFLWSKEMEQRKLKIEERKLNLEEMRIKNEFKLKLEELASKERMHRFELHLKYKDKK